MSIHEDIAQHPWEYLGAAALPLYITIYPPLYTQGFFDRFGVSTDILYMSDYRKAYWFIRRDRLEELAIRTLPEIVEEEWSWYDRCVRELRGFQTFNQTFLKQDLAVLSDEELRSFMLQYRTTFMPPFVTNNIIEAQSYYLLHHLKDMLIAEGIDASHAMHLIDQYGQTAAPNYLRECAEEFRRAQDDTAREIVRRKYYYIFNDYLGEKEVTFAELKKLADSTPYEVAERFHTTGISERAQKLLIALQAVATVQDVRKAELLEMVSAAKRFGIEFARRSNTPFEDIEYATWYELEAGRWNIDDLRARRGIFVMYWTVDNFSSYYGEEAARLLKEAEQNILHVAEGATEVGGVCASKGAARGRAVVVFNTSEFDKVQPGDILFTVMTRPEFLPVMHHAAAFVCDEGGLTSHAAIVAREMKKPCIVGTRIGTRVFKDGDMVEVDAEKGIVRKI
ncbi:MAG: PEP-utilizing enzyme [Patescibacteria group bacterium]